MNAKVELLTAAKRYLWDGITPPTTSTPARVPVEYTITSKPQT